MKPPADPPAPASETPRPGVEVIPTKPEGRWVDVMGGDARREIRLGEHGFIALVDVMPRLVPEGQTADQAVVQAARVSYGQGTTRIHEDRGLIRYLMRHQHTTPFEMIEFKFHVSMPIFVARQWIRHRTASVNEYSARYSVVPDRFYRPTAEDVRRQSATNRQGGSEPVEEATAAEFLDLLQASEERYADYERMIEKGVARELARTMLPLSAYTQWYWKCDLHNTMHFLALRMDEHAQLEIREFALAMHALLEPIVPISMEAFRDYRLDAVRLSRLEIEALRTSGELATENRRERQEWAQKRRRLEGPDGGR